jgi:hypothetical protein
VRNDPPVYPGRLDPSDRFRERRSRARRRRRLQRLALLIVVVGVVVALTLNAMPADKPSAESATTSSGTTSEAAPASSTASSRLPSEIRGVHVTAALASIPGKLDHYVAMKAQGLNTVELDVKDENGEIGFTAGLPALAGRIGAAHDYYDAHAVAKRVHAAGLYLIGRVVVFEDPRLASARPGLAVQEQDGSVWEDGAGLSWTNPYDERVWEYNVAVAEAAARAGFDEIMFDYVRFPSDPSIAQAVFPVRIAGQRHDVIADFVEYAANRLRPLGVRVSAALFGLSATRDLGIGQRPSLLGQHLDAVYPMVYPSHYNTGEYNLDDPSATPGLTVSHSLLDFRLKLRGKRAEIVPWLQDFFGYSLADIEQEISAARRAQARGYMLWNPTGVYTHGALAPR